MSNIEGIIRSLIKAKAGGVSGEAEKRNIILGLKEYSSDQRLRGILLIVLLLVLIIAPIFLAFIELSPEILPYLMGGSGIFAAGTIQLLLDTLKSVSTAQTLVMVCQGLESTDAKEVLSAWLNELNKQKK